MIACQWIDQELNFHSTSPPSMDDPQLDLLLDLRDFLSQIENIEPAAVVRGYFRFRKLLGDRYYLLFYRLRSWLSGRYLLQISDSLQRSPTLYLQVDLKAQDFEQCLNLAKNQFFETAENLVPLDDLRCKITHAKLGPG